MSAWKNSASRGLAQCDLFVSIPDSIEELCAGCFRFRCKLIRVKFGDSSSLGVISKRAFYQCPVQEIQDSVEELGDQCFAECKSLLRVIFGE